MTGRSVIHNTFTIERSYLATPSRVLAAFASAEAKNIWYDTGEAQDADGEAAVAEFDFRVGGGSASASSGSAHVTCLSAAAVGKPAQA